MSQSASESLAASVRARLLNRAKVEQSDFNGMLVRYALERLLYRLSQSSHAERFLLKGATGESGGLNFDARPLFIW